MKNYLRIPVASAKLFWVGVFLHFLILGAGSFEHRIPLPAKIALLILSYSFCFVLYILFLSGFVYLGHRQDNRWLKFSSCLFIASIAVIPMYMAAMLIIQILSEGSAEAGLKTAQTSPVPLFLVFALLLGPKALFGMGLLTLKSRFGARAVWAGLLEIASAVGGALTELGLAFLLFIPVFILESKLLRRAQEESEVQTPPQDGRGAHE